MLRAGEYQVSLSSMLTDASNRVYVLLAYAATKKAVEGFSEAFTAAGKAECTFSRGRGKKYVNCPRNASDFKFEAVVRNVTVRKQKYWGILLVSRDHETIYAETGKEGEAFYDFLMERFHVPLLPEWSEQLLRRLEENGRIKAECLRENKGDYKIPGEFFPEGGLRIINVRFLTEQDVLNAVQGLIAEERIRISGKENAEAVTVSNLEEYFREYREEVLTEQRERVKPLTEVKGEIGTVAFLRRRLYPQQIDAVRAADAVLNEHHAVLLAQEMGTGKTLEAIALVEARENAKRMKSGKTLPELLADPDAVNYRVLVQGPTHMLEKYKREIEGDVVHARCQILDSEEKALALRNAGKPKGKEFYILSKEQAKLRYTEMPSPKKVVRQTIQYKVCDHCGKTHLNPGKKCPYCGKLGWHFEMYCPRCYETFPGPRAQCPHCGNHNIRPENIVPGSARIGNGPDGYVCTPEAKGMACPCCGRILLPLARLTEKNAAPLGPGDFAKKSTRNAFCFWCGESLWQPFTKTFGERKRPPAWVTARRYSNKTHKTVTTEWVYRARQALYERAAGEEFISFEESEGGPRKVDLASILSRKARFDYLILDEAQDYRNAATAQAVAASKLIARANKVIALTGTPSDGTCRSMFHLLYQLFPDIMKSRGYAWKDAGTFTQDFGSVEKVYAVVEEDGEYNSTSRGKQIGSTREMPGISTFVYAWFMLPVTVFLNIRDMGRELPDLKEEVRVIEPSPEEETLFEDYFNVIDKGKQMAYERGGLAVQAQVLQFALSYPDRPYGPTEILNPDDGTVVAEIPQHKEYAGRKLTSKEEEFQKILRAELSEGRNVFVYAEFTGKAETNVQKRLRALAEACGVKAAILDSAAVPTAGREAWIRAKTREGVRVIITNPRCVETGLDFVWDDREGKGNYPTIIFYQVGWSLYVSMQASRRHLRLTQKEECRTYYLAWADTLQLNALKLMAEKSRAAAALQGVFTTEGLTALTHGVDARQQLAKELFGAVKVSGADVQAMFAEMNRRSGEDPYKDVTPMPLVAELLDWQEEEEEEDIFAFLDEQEQAQEEVAAASETQTAEQPPAGEENRETDIWDELLGVLGPAAAVAVPVAKKQKRRQKKETVVYGSIFDLFKT